MNGISTDWPDTFLHMTLFRTKEQSLVRFYTYSRNEVLILIKICEICGDEYEAYRSTQKYCKVCGKNSKGARKRYERAVHTNKVHAGELYSPKEYVCKYCGKSFFTSYGRRFCSKDCEKEYIVENNTCTYCQCKLIDKGIRIPYYGRVFCSEECRIAFRESRKSKPTEAEQIVPEGEELLRCLICNKLFQRPISNEPYVCSSECNNVYQAKRIRQQSAIKEVEKNPSDKKKDEVVHMCTKCKTSYKDCTWMKSKYTRYPTGAVVKDGNVISCPKFT